MRGTIIKAYVVLRNHRNASENMEKAIQEHTKTVAAPYKYPREIEFVTELPKTQSGKIKRKELRELEKQKKGVLK
jgi:acetyl-CoA synthetase